MLEIDQNTPEFSKKEIGQEKQHANRSIICYSGHLESILGYFPKQIHNGRLSIVRFMAKETGTKVHYKQVSKKLAYEWMRGLATHFDLCRAFNVDPDVVKLD